MTIEDNAVIDAMYLLASGRVDDPLLVAVESAVAGIASAIAAAAARAAAQAIQLNADSCIVAISTKGDTDPQGHCELVVRLGDEVRAAATMRVKRHR